MENICYELRYLPAIRSLAKDHALVLLCDVAHSNRDAVEVAIVSEPTTLRFWQMSLLDVYCVQHDNLWPHCSQETQRWRSSVLIWHRVSRLAPKYPEQLLLCSLLFETVERTIALATCCSKSNFDRSLCQKCGLMMHDT